MKRWIPLLVSCVVAALCLPAAASARVLLVGTYHHVHGKYTTINAAVRAAHAGDWILIGPGTYKDPSVHKPAGAVGEDRAGAQILITKPGLHLRGMNRNSVIVDGTAPGSPACSAAGKDQVFGPKDSKGETTGRSGILVYKARNVWVENLTLCNFLDGSQGGGNQIWWDAGAGSGTQSDLGAWYGRYLTATSYYYPGPGKPVGSYGIYSSNTKTGHGLLAYDYASNMDDSGFYVGACPDCNVTLDHIHAQNSILGYSGTDSGGNILVTHSEFDHNQDGFDTNSQNNDDAPPPQDGACPNGGVNPSPPPGVQQTHSCLVVTNSSFHDNNNVNVPSSGTASNGPPGTGMSISGGRNDVITHNRFYNNDGWGILVVPFPDLGPPPPIAHCQGGTPDGAFGPGSCYFEAFGNEIANNTFAHNGGFGNPSNGDIGEISSLNTPGNCYHGNVDTSGALTSDPANIQATHGQCGVPNSGNDLSSTLAAQAICATQVFGPCPATPGMTYPRATKVQMPKVPAQRTMPDPCRGVPTNAFCRARTSAVRPTFTG